MKSNVLARNMKALRRRMPVLARALEVFPASGCEYIVEDAKDGSPTLAIKKDDKVYQVHSKYNPGKEAEQQVQNSKLVNPKLLLILGLGLGYHVRACLEQLKGANLFIVLIERDIDALRAALESVDITDLIESDKIRWVIGVPENEGFAVLSDMIRVPALPCSCFSRLCKSSITRSLTRFTVVTTSTCSNVSARPPRR